MSSIVHVDPGVELGESQQPNESSQPHSDNNHKNNKNEEEEVNEEEGPWIAQVKSRLGIENTHGLSNAITTTKYSIITWLPKSLWEQFRRIANVYFLVISILMLIGTYAQEVFSSPLDPFSTVITLIFVLMVTSVKEGMEDLERARSDKDENLSKATIVTFENGKEVERVIRRQDIQAGDIVKLVGHCVAPADLLLIATSYYADGNQCYVETANIDGETNLKLREAPAKLKSLIPADGVIPESLFQGRIEFEPPNKNIHNFIGALHLDAIPDPIALGANNLLLRSSLFSNTEWGYGVAVYCGQETKIQMNNRHAPSKMSKLEGYVNKAIILIFYAQIALVTASIISIYALGYDDKNDFPYLYPTGNDSTSVLPLWLEQWFVFFLLYNNFIPISLYVTIELVNLGQAYLMTQDKEMYDETLNMPCAVRSSNLAQELGLVSNIFSDKTGTLTRNEMKFVQFIVDEKLYHVSPDSDLLHSLQSDHNASQSKIYQFLLCLTTCHTVIREKNGTYRAESPDELALVEGAAKYNCGLLERGTTSMLCEMIGNQRQFDVLAVNAFNSDRKRMSIIIKDQVTNQYVLMCKGADNIMLPRCAMPNEQRSECEKSLLDLACEGLRTLCVARKILDTNYAENWLRKYNEAASALQNRAERLGQVAEELETSMELLGITAIEDRLQDEVPEVIADLAKAGIVLWMLTGDKEETAINIGHSCNLLQSDTQQFFLTRINDSDEYNTRLLQVADDVEQARLRRVIDIQNGNVASEIALVMDGPSFKFFGEDNLEHRRLLLQIGKACRSVIACRLTPVQKQQLVNLIKVDTKPKATTLSIGDGANDVSMIREADVGVGIFGKEGRQAANNADFAIGQFKFLRKLLLVHGRWNYCRQSKVFLYSMHKNMVITLTLFWFSYFTAVSGTSMYQSWVYSVYNFALGLPIIFYGIFDQDVPFEFALKNPEVYLTGLSNKHLNLQTISIWILNACLYAVVFCLIWFNVVAPSFVDYDLYSMGTTIYVGLVFALQLKVGLIHNLWNQVHFWSMAISVGGLFLFLYVLNTMTGESYIDFYGVANKIYALDLFWFFGFWSTPIFCILIDFIGYSFYTVFFPTNEMVYREAGFGIATKDSTLGIYGFAKK
mmetsp:Transcript_4746/g.4793  ORF Transcript_4746/g.4793 Transcript_4746/m.4793 type:complete len:1124 (-) Transcript_4746:25-3396(-)